MAVTNPIPVDSVVALKSGVTVKIDGVTYTSGNVPERKAVEYIAKNIQRANLFAPISGLVNKVAYIRSQSDILVLDVNSANDDFIFVEDYSVRFDTNEVLAILNDVGHPITKPSKEKIEKKLVDLRNGNSGTWLEVLDALNSLL